MEDRCRIRFAARSRQHQIGMPSATLGPSGKSGRQTKVPGLATLNLAALPLFCLTFLQQVFYSDYHAYVHRNNLPHLACCCDLRRQASNHVCRLLKNVDDSRQSRAFDRVARRAMVACSTSSYPQRISFPLVRLIKPTGSILAALAVQQAEAFIGSCSSASYACRQSSDMKRDQEMCNQKEGNSVLPRTMLCRVQDYYPANNTDDIAGISLESYLTALIKVFKLNASCMQGSINGCIASSHAPCCLAMVGRHPRLEHNSTRVANIRQQYVLSPDAAFQDALHCLFQCLNLSLMWFTHLIILLNPNTTASEVCGWMPHEALELRMV